MKTSLPEYSIRKPTIVDLFLLALLALMWASSFLAIKVIVPDTGPLWLATIRVSIAFIALLPLAMMKGWIWPQNINEWRLVSIVMLLNVVIPFFLISWAEQQIDAGVTSLLMGVGPFMALLGSHFTTHDDKLSRQKLTGAILGFTGIIVLVGWGAVQDLGNNLSGQAAAILGAACYVTSGLLIRKLGRFPADRLSALVIGMASITLVIITSLIDGLPTHNFSNESWILLLYLGLFPTALGYILRYHLIKKVGLSTFSSSLNLIPVFGVLLSALLLGETLSANLMISLILIVTGLYIIRRG